MIIHWVPKTRTRRHPTKLSGDRLRSKPTEALTQCNTQLLQRAEETKSIKTD